MVRAGSRENLEMSAPKTTMRPERRATRSFTTRGAGSRKNTAWTDHALITGSFAPQLHHREIQSEQSPVPPSAHRLFLTAGKSVVIKLCAHIERRLVRKRISFQ